MGNETTLVLTDPELLIKSHRLSILDSSQGSATRTKAIEHVIAKREPYRPILDKMSRSVARTRPKSQQG